MFHMVITEDIDEVISRFDHGCLSKPSVCLNSKEKIARWFENMKFIFEW